MFNGLDLTVARGECLTLFGANGVGKTTLLRTIATLTRPDSGQVLVHGLDSRREARRVRGLVGFIGHQTLLYGELTVRENLVFYGRMYGLADLPSRMAEVVALLGLGDTLDTRVDRLSHGLQKRAAIARAILHDPPLLLADEPEAGLDPAHIAALGTVLKGGERQRTVVMVTHSLESGLALGDRVAVLAGGRIACESRAAVVDPDTLRARYEVAAGAA